MINAFSFKFINENDNSVDIICGDLVDLSEFKKISSKSDLDFWGIYDSLDSFSYMVFSNYECPCIILRIK